MTQSFLSFLAQHYITRDNLKDYCFIFPNRRAGTFFAEMLRKHASRTLLSPKITNITSFVTSLTKAIPVNRIESIFILYSAYKNLGAGADITFDRFARWADTILNDFNDVEQYMVDAKDIFRNLFELRQIRSNYVTPELREVLSHFFNMPQHECDEENFWQHIQKNEDGEISLRQGFVSIWNSLYQLFTAYNEELSRRGLSYAGKMYADAARRVKTMRPDEFRYKQYVFVGFNNLTQAEHTIFASMRDKGIAQFHWDYNSPAFALSTNKATHFLSQYIKEFKPPFEEEVNDTFPDNLNIIGLPTNIGQTKEAAMIVDRLATQGIINADNAIDTAIVLPDQGIFLPLIKAVNGTAITKANVTMGLSIRNSSIATLMDALSRMHYQARTSKGELCYFHADVRDVLLHPIVKFRQDNEAQRLLEHINANSVFNVPFSLIQKLAPTLAPLFTIVTDFTTAEVFQYFDNIIRFTGDVLAMQTPAKGDDNGTPSGHLSDGGESTTTSIVTIEQAFLQCYRNALEEIQATIAEYNAKGIDIKTDISTFCFMLSRLVSPTQLPLEGEPLGGLQIMGVLETRCLDFKNLIVLSMNERVFPKKHFTKSFIPQNMRRAYGMATLEHQESMLAYYFYRMISRAQNVYLIYDSRTEGIGFGEHSRFINQLQTLYGPKCKVTHNSLNIGIQAPPKMPVTVRKDGRIMQLLQAFQATIPADKEKAGQLTKAGTLRYLSAHSIDVYIKCPLQFYLRYVECLPEEEEMSLFMKPSTFGTIVHNVLREIYTDDTEIDADYINNLLNKDNKKIVNSIIANTNREYNHKGTHDKPCYDALVGEAMLKQDVALEFVHRVLNYDLSIIRNTGPIKYLQGEKPITCPITVGDTTFNLTFIIDRLDQVNNGNGTTRLRIVDYKTGTDKTSFTKVDQLFQQKEHLYNAMRQLLLYCIAYDTYAHTTGNTTIEPTLYTVLDMSTAGIRHSKKQVIYPDSPVIEDFRQMLADKIKELFSPDTDFTQTKDPKTCGYCTFKEFCHK